MFNPCPVLKNHFIFLQPDVDTTTFPSATNSGMIASGLDYETLTLMRLRQAERARLEREIREREAAEGD